MKIFRTYDVATRQNKFFLLIVCFVVSVLLLSSVNHVSCSLELDSQTNERAEPHEELNYNTTEDFCCDGLPCNIEAPVCCAPPLRVLKEEQLDVEKGVFVLMVSSLAIVLLLALLIYSVIDFLVPNNATFSIFVFRLLIGGLLLMSFGFKLTCVCIIVVYICTNITSFFFTNTVSNTQVDTPSTSE